MIQFFVDKLIVPLICSVLTGIILKLIEYVRKYQSLKLIKLRICNKNEYIRFSISYLFKIQIDEKYLLIKSNRIDLFQPVGGVYKRYNSSLDIFSEYEVLSDENIVIDDQSRKDLRVKVKGKYIFKFLDWFNSNRNREVSVNREFIEELIIPGFLDESEMLKFQPEFLKRTQLRIGYSTHFKCKEILMHDIYKIELDDSAITKLRKSIKDHPEKLKLVTSENIISENFEEDGIYKRIGKHTKYVL